MCNISANSWHGFQDFVQIFFSALFIVHFVVIDDPAVLWRAKDDTQAVTLNLESELKAERMFKIF